MLTIPLFLESRVLVVVVNVQQGIKYLSKYFLLTQNDVSVTRLHPLAAVTVIIMSELLQQKRKTYIYLLRLYYLLLIMIC